VGYDVEDGKQQEQPMDATMSKKKAAKAKDQHKSGFMVRLPEEYRAKLLALAQRTKRKMTTEVQISLDKHFADEGVK
jgi:hypothetical protein